VHLARAANERERSVSHSDASLCTAVTSGPIRPPDRAICRMGTARQDMKKISEVPPNSSRPAASSLARSTLLASSGAGKKFRQGGGQIHRDGPTTRTVPEPLCRSTDGTTHQHQSFRWIVCGTTHLDGVSPSCGTTTLLPMKTSNLKSWKP
jgi:hypothetical protein